MRVLSVGNLFPPAGGGGYERIWADGVAALRAAGAEVSVLTTRPTAGARLPDGWTDAAWVRRELEWYWLDHAWRRPGLAAATTLEIRNQARLAAVLEEVRPDVVSWWSLGGLSLGLVEAVRRRGVPAVGVVADGWMVYGPRVDRFQARRGGLVPRALRERATGVPWRLDLGAAAEWVCISEAVRAACERAAGPLERTSLAHPGVDGDRFPAAPEREWDGRLLVCGRVEPAKGVEHAVRALAAGDPTWTLTVDGGGSAEHLAQLRGLAERLGVAGRITWQRSAPEDLGAVYAAHDCLLFPVVWPEPWGLVPLEAMRVGRPVVACVGGGTAEYLRDEGNGLAVPAGDGAAIAAAVGRLAGDPALRERLVATGRETAARFTREAFDAAVVAAHERAVAR